jgi:hypothetical protein
VVVCYAIQSRGRIVVCCMATRNGAGPWCGFRDWNVREAGCLYGKDTVF